MKYLLPCPCGKSVKIETSQAGQTVVCSCGENLLVPSMLKIKALPEAQEKTETLRSKKQIPFLAACINFLIGMACLIIAFLMWLFSNLLLLFEFRWFGSNSLMFLLFCGLRGLTAAFWGISAALAIRDLVNVLSSDKSPLTEDSTLCRTFLTLGIALLFPACLLASYLYAWKPEPLHVTLKDVYKSYGSNQRMIYQDSEPLDYNERVILSMTDQKIDRMAPMNLYFYFQTLETPQFGLSFYENYDAVKDSHRIWITVNIILFILSILSMTASFFMPKQEVIVTGWSGSDWQ